MKTAFRLDYDPDTLAFAVLSIPNMFEQSLLPFIEEERCDCLSKQDPLDQCMRQCFKKIKDEFKDYDIKEIHDYETHPNRRPKILVQTVGHVAGAAFYYQKDQLKNVDKKEKLFGVSVHPKYAGWFAFRGVLIFENLKCPGLVQKEPQDVLETDEMKYELLRRFNHDWKNWSYRDIITPDTRYSERQKEFFITPPSQRQELVKGYNTK